MTMRFSVKVATVLLAGLSALPALAAVDAYMMIKGKTQGQFKGEASRAGHPDEIKLVSVKLYSANGMSNGTHQHRRVVITKSIGVASLQLQQAAAMNEVLPEVTILFAKADGKGKLPTPLETVRLKNAAIVSRRIVGNTEEIELAYQQIEVTQVDGSTSTSDDWEVPNN
ncbi:MAG: type VI secretion system tube protein Hcp [Acidobacteriaceae bacterium]